MQVEKTEEFLGVIDLEEDGDTPDDQGEDQSNPNIVGALWNVVHLLDDRPPDVDPRQFDFLHLTALPDQTAHCQIKNTDNLLSKYNHWQLTDRIEPNIDSSLSKIHYGIIY